MDQHGRPMFRMSFITDLVMNKADIQDDTSKLTAGIQTNHALSAALSVDQLTSQSTGGVLRLPDQGVREGRLQFQPCFQTEYSLL